MLSKTLNKIHAIPYNVFKSRVWKKKKKIKKVCALNCNVECVMHVQNNPHSKHPNLSSNMNPV